MTQSDFGNIDPNVNNGTQLASMLNNWRNAVHTLHSGSSRPSYVQPGMLWINTSGGATAWLVNIYLGPTMGDKALFTLDTTTGAAKMLGDISQATGGIAGQSLAFGKTGAADILTPINTPVPIAGLNTGLIGAAGQKWRFDAGVTFSNTANTFDFYSLDIWDSTHSVRIGQACTVVSSANSLNVQATMAGILTMTAPSTIIARGLDGSTANGTCVGGYLIAERLS